LDNAYLEWPKKSEMPECTGGRQARRVGAVDGGYAGSEHGRQALKVLLDLFERQDVPVPLAGFCSLARA